MEANQITIDVPLKPIESEHLRIQIEAAPEGHVIMGPSVKPPFWACVTCGCRWSDGFHPDPAARQRVRDMPPEEKPKIGGGFWGEGDELPWWVK